MAVPTVVCSQIFEDLPDQLEQFVIRCEGRGWQRRQIPTWRDHETRASSLLTFGLTQLLGEYSPPRRGRSTTAGDLPPLYHLRREWNREGNAEKQPKRQFAQRSVSRQGEGHQTAVPPPTSMKCFCCGQQGHRALECLAPAPVLRGSTPPKWKKAMRKPPEKANLCTKPLRSEAPNKQQGRELWQQESLSCRMQTAKKMTR
ncbi:hypothetical protein E2320_002032, partial [Naja naja]